MAWGSLPSWGRPRSGSGGRGGNSGQTPSQRNGWPSRTLPSGQVIATGPSPLQDWQRSVGVTYAGRSSGASAPWYTHQSNQSRTDAMNSQILGGSTNRTGTAVRSTGGGSSPGGGSRSPGGG